MADSNLSGKADKAASGILWLYIVPMLLGAIATTFFFVYVPEVIAMLDKDYLMKTAILRGATETWAMYMEVFTGRKSFDLYLFAWPMAGAVCGIFMNRLYTKL